MPETAAVSERQDLVNMIQADGEAMLGIRGSTPQGRADQQETPPETKAPTAAVQGPNSQAAPTAAPTTGDGKLYLDKFKTEEEAKRAHHLLIHGTNSLKAENDKLRATVEQLSLQMSPGRVDPTTGPTDRGSLAAEDEKWLLGYGIKPEDFDARVQRNVQAALQEFRKPEAAQAAADTYMTSTYPEFPLKVQEVRAFVAANEPLRDRVATLWSAGHFSEAMEIGWLAYDNSLRTAQAVMEANAATQAKVNADRANAGVSSSGLAASREVVATPGNLPSGNAYPSTPEDWQLIRDMKAAGRDTEVRRILYGHTIANIPAFRPRE